MREQGHVTKAKKVVTEKDLRKLIREEIMPLMKKENLNYSEEDLLEYEEETLKGLSKEALADVSGGISVKSALWAGGILLMALLGGVGLSTRAMDKEPPSPLGEERRFSAGITILLSIAEAGAPAGKFVPEVLRV